MSKTLTLDSYQAEQLREQHYNATLAKVVDRHDDLRIMRVVPDAGVPSFHPGQYTSLGLGYWEPRVEGVQPEEVDERHLRRVAKRAYSISCSLLNDRQELVRTQDCPYLEFFVALVRRAERHAPVLTPRLFAIREGSRLFIDPKVHGTYSLDHVAPTNNVIFLATGTGEAPHNAMLAELLSRKHQGRIVSAVCVRYHSDLAYLAAHRQLEQRFPDYRYVTLTTREPENLDPTTLNFVGKQYLQDYVKSGDFERDAEFVLTPETTRVFLCGSPAMIGVPLNHQRDPQPGGMIDVLQQRGFTADRPKHPGNVHFERYW